MSKKIEAVDLSKQLQEIFRQGLKGLIFDCDGVLVDSKEANISYYNLLLSHLGKGPIAEQDEEFVQMCSVEQAADFLFSSTELELLPDLVKQYPYSTWSLPKLELEPGVLALLTWAKEQGLQLGVHTNRGKGMAEVLYKFDLAPLFTQIMTTDKVEPKPSPQGCLRILTAWQLQPSQVAFLGDSLTDQEASKGAQIPLLAYKNPKLSAALHIQDFTVLHQAIELMVSS